MSPNFALFFPPSSSPWLLYPSDTVVFPFTSFVAAILEYPSFLEGSILTAKLFELFLLKLSVSVSMSLMLSMLFFLTGFPRNIFALSENPLPFRLIPSIFPEMTSSESFPACIPSIFAVTLLVINPFFTRIPFALLISSLSSFIPILLFRYFDLRKNSSFCVRRLSMSVISSSERKKTAPFSVLSPSGEGSSFLKMLFSILSCLALSS